MRTWTKARGMQVVTVAEGAMVGKLDDAYVVLESGAVLGYRVKSGLVFSSNAACAADQLLKLGRDVVLIRGEASLEKAGGRGEDEGRVWLSDYLGRKVISRRGEQLGEVEDLVVDEAGARVRALLVGDKLVKVDGRASLGRDAVICEDAGVPVVVGEERVESPEWWVKVGALLG